MAMRIRVLSPLIANQIAAGEVIERPASVVKELLENSLDAGADVIHIDIGYGGLNQIKISDNGSGILAEDLPLAIAAHATSKITSLNDLYAIGSMGFRGEALASIAAVAKVAISSRPPSQEHAMMLQVQGTQHTLRPCARGFGTTIDVNDLFFNAPVRKRFLKNERLEFQAIESIVKRFAFSAPHIALTLNHNNKLVLSLPAAVNEQTKLARMTKILGNTFMNNALFLDVEQSGMRLYGWISGPNLQRSQSDRQWVYINQRMVKDKLIQHALKQAYDGLLHPGRFPSCLLYLTLNTAELDVNVHPTKHEVRFQQPRLVHDFLVMQLTQALAGVHSPEHEVISALVQEPEPVFDFKSQKMFQPERLSMKQDSVWVAVNSEYALCQSAQEYYLVNIQALYQTMLEEQLKESSFPLASRPLLVPVRYPLVTGIKAQFATVHQLCQFFGIQIRLADESILIDTIPLCAPYLDLRCFLDRVFALEQWTVVQLQEIFYKSQCLDSVHLNQDEREMLLQYLQQVKDTSMNTTGIFKALNAAHCRMLIDA